MKKKVVVAIVVVSVLIIGVVAAVVLRDKDKAVVMEKYVETTNAVYDISINMDKENDFQVQTMIDVTNDSTDAWSDIGFYLVPNAMNAEETQAYEDDRAQIEISSITVDGKEVSYTLENNGLLVELETQLDTGSGATVTVDYSMTLPQNGMRLSQVDDNFYLAHWYPMLALYRNGWDINDYDAKGESYNTDYGDFIVSYELPKDYLVASSGNDGPIKAASTGTVKGENIKDFYMAIMDPDEWEFETIQANDTQLNVFTRATQNILEETSSLAVDAYLYFEVEIGDNPFTELDIIANDGYMEYPNVIEVAADGESQEMVLVHEIAHQWFYYLVTNDPYYESWLDEGFTEFSSSLFLSDRYDDEEYGFWGASSAEQYYRPEKYVNLPLSKFSDETYYSTIYGKVPMVLKEYFDENGGRERALLFLSAYYEEFQFKQVNTEEFKMFFEEYFEGDQSKFLDSWLK
ncbi:Aminopeptidase N [Planococcus halocryophilus Or1]|uniref:Peptidase n=1 Tax=Planococcus halocryophilus TaxID=1215089 RepID=A0A1C7DP55_9BACL|nr:M1 family metallopeptidase [Planococcus halocryophilus]ANU13255.1 peptidase [Planococcus halocryophilus]EMF45269.1 Aminopeptidase N [Planococcus halocryophilus Or1]